MNAVNLLRKPSPEKMLNVPLKGNTNPDSYNQDDSILLL